MPLEIRGSHPDELPKTVALLDTVWPWQRNEAMLTRDPGYRREQTRVAVLDGQIVSTAQVVRRRMWVAGRVVRVGFVGNVVTAVGHRRRGYASAVLRDAIAYMKSNGYELSMLHAAAPQLYEGLGWRRVPERLTSFHFAPSPADCQAGEYTVRQGNWETDLGEVASIYDAYNTGRTGAIVRSLPYWRACRLWLAHEDDGRFIVVERRGRIVAYARGEQDHNVIMESGYLPEASGAVPVLFAAIKERFAAGQFVAHLPEDGVVDSYLAAHAKALSRSISDVPGAEPAMFRPLQAQSLDALSGFCFYATDHF